MAAKSAIRLLRSEMTRANPVGEPVNESPAKDWRAAAVVFYDGEAEIKSQVARHKLFVRSYRRVLDRLGLPAGSALVDAGCGCGELAGAAVGSSIRVVGVDLSPVSLRTATNFHPEDAFLEADLHRLPFGDNSFDGAAAITSVEFCRDRPAVLRELGRILKTRGRLYLDVRNDAFWPFRLLQPLLPLLQKIRILEPYPADGFRDLTLGEWKAMLAKEGFSLHSEHPSVWPWNFGSLLSRCKNLVIQVVKVTLPLRHHYMVGLVLEKRPG